MSKYRVLLKLAGMYIGEWTSYSLSEALSDYLIISQTWFEAVLFAYPDVTLETI